MRCVLFSLVFLVVVQVFAASSQCLYFYSGVDKKQIQSEIEETLFIGYPVTVKPFSANKNKNPLWLVTLENPKTKKQVKAIFKPRRPGDGDGWNRPPLEYVSYEVSKLLDLDVIPPVAYRYAITLDGEFFHEGSMQFFVEGATLLKEIDKKNWNVDADDFVSNARIMDILLQNPDRHAGNFIYGANWIDGIKKPLLIDQAANMRAGTNIRLSTKGPFNDQMITHFDPHTIAKLRTLSENQLMKFVPFISVEEVKHILNNRDGILKFIDSRSLGK